MKSNIIAAGLISIIFMMLLFLVICTSCTISFQNISTHGVANDLVDENQKTDADIKPNISIPTGVI